MFLNKLGDYSTVITQTTEIKEMPRFLIFSKQMILKQFMFLECQMIPDFIINNTKIFSQKYGVLD